MLRLWLTKMCNYYPSRCLVNFKLTFEAVDFFFLVTYFFDFETNKYGKYGRKLLAFFFEQLKNNRVKQRGSWAEWLKEAPTKWQISRSSPVFVSWNFCLIKGATFSPQNLKGSASIALVQIIGALGPGTVMGKRLTKKLTIFHNETFYHITSCVVF